MLRKGAALLMFLALAAGAWGQGLNVPPGVTKDDWEEINFEFNSSTLVDGFPSLLRLAELLQQNPGYKVQVDGHTDVIGGTQYNDRLGLARANAVRDFLIKYGAQAGQITATSEGKASPRYPGQREAYSKTDEARYMNRRVSLTVTDAQGRTVGAAGGSAAEAIRAIQPAAPAGVADCCSEVLKKLDKLDDIAKMLQNLGDQNADLKKQLADLKAAQQVLESKVNQPPPPPAPAPPTAGEVGREVAKEIEAKKEPKFQMLGMNVGIDDTGNTTFSGKGRYFSPFGEHFALQAQAEYLYFKTDREGQLDLGMVDRLGHFQAGLFASFKHASLSQFQNGGTLGQGALTLDYIFKRGKIGLFGTKGFMDSALVNVANATDPVSGALLNHLFNYSYLQIVDQAGVSGTVALFGNVYLEGNAGYLHSQVNGNRFGGTARFVFPLNSHVAFTLEGGINETLLEPHNSGRVVAGVELGNMLRPKELLAADHAVPADVPRVRYEIVTKKVRNGDDPPVADAGPNQINVPAGLITLNGSGSYSPDGNPITYLWTESVGPQGVTLSAPTSAITTFTAVAGQYYTFRLLVKDNFGGQGFAYVNISTKAANPGPSIGFFTATPAAINSGQSSTLSYSVTNATSVTISGVSGTLSPSTGSVPVSPTVTTTYTLTATNAIGSTTANVTVVVNAAVATLTSCYATPTNIISGETATLNWMSSGATAVSITPGIGAVALNGNYAVTPTATTTYTITATGAGGATATCNIAVTVTPGQVPRIIRFSATPPTIHSGQSSTLAWVVENATTVSINNGVGSVLMDGSQSVSPTATTAYTLTATNSFGSVTAMATVSVIVIPPPTITSFTATPSPSPGPGTKVTLTCVTQNAVNVNIAGAMFLGATDSFVVFPNVTTTYTCIATNQPGQVAQASLTVVVPPSPAPSGPPPVVVFAGGNTITTTVRTLTLDASQSSSPAGNTPLTFYWSIAAGNGASIVGATTATPSVTVGVPDGEYDFQCVVTDSKGNSASGVVHVMLVSTATTN